jgi:hypothetical protein
MRTSRTASFRRSVVSVAAAFAAAPGCSLDHSPGGGVMNPPTCDEQPGASGCIPPVECSSAAPPEEGAPCSRDGASCTYDSCQTPDGIGEAVCSDGRWELLEVSCNPPLQDCPAEQPAEGAPCDVADTEFCGYGDCYGVSVIDAYCEEGAWRIYESSCNPPELGCPDEPPARGDFCDISLDTVCEYGDCYGEPTATATCVSQLIDDGDVAYVWDVSETTCNPPPVEVECPVEAPEASTPCAYVGDEPCGYYDCSGTPSLVAECIGGMWQTREMTCNPPEFEG